jgi:hypothetical protein
LLYLALKIHANLSDPSSFICNTSISLHLYTTAPLQLRTYANLQLCNSTPLQLYTSTSLHLCTSAPMQFRNSAIPHFCTSALLHFCNSAPLQLCTSTSTPSHRQPSSMSQGSKSHREKQRNMAAPSPQTGEVNCLPNAIIHCALNIGDFLDKADINTLTRLLPFDNARFRSLNHRLNQFPD